MRGPRFRVEGFQRFAVGFRVDRLPFCFTSSGAASLQVLRNTMCCRCFGLALNPRYEVRFLAVVLALVYCPELSFGAPVLGSTICCRCFALRFVVPVPRSTICCHCFGLGLVPQR